MKHGRIRVSSAKWTNPGEYREKVESVRVPKKLYRQLPKYGRISVSTSKWNNPGEYREKVESVRVPKNCTDDYPSMVASV